ncbi:hypothetical protein Cfor_09164 [Coptotermes formosanus]|uniref:Odorant receptor n=1 Tax=Coptotermes formosanus TaxID=36987 RepID=A0A6L2PYI4_COPFO|nr:hypothetical protein Cfor_11861 [Coptotermes formosanus]GFG37569.1 hypothetical protein Cfor_09164 [Coptotermes formosanus]
MKQAESTLTKESKEQMVKGHHQEFVKLQLFALMISGLLPPKSCSTSRWKSILYDLYTVLSFIFHIPFFTLQSMGIYACWGNVPIVAGIIFQMTVCFDGLVILVYFTYHRKYLLHIFDMFETEFLPYIKKVGCYQKQDTLIRKGTKSSNTMTKTLMTTFVIAMSAWCIFPFFVKCWSHDPYEELANNTTGRQHFEYFVIATWLPDNALAFPTYEIIYACQFFYTWSMVASFTVGNMVFSSLFYGISIQFQLVSAAIQDIDIFVDFKADLSNQEDKSLNGTISDSDVADMDIYNVETFREPKQVQSSTCRFSLNPISNVYTGDTPCRNVTSSADWPALYTNRPNCAETVYMTDCIHYHQRVLK